MPFNSRLCILIWRHPNDHDARFTALLYLQGTPFLSKGLALGGLRRSHLSQSPRSVRLRSTYLI